MVELVIDRHPDEVPAREIGDQRRACVAARARLDAHEAALLTRLTAVPPPRARAPAS